MDSNPASGKPQSKNRTRTTGNEAAFRSNTGRQNNREKSTEGTAPARSGKPKRSERPDRRSQTGKVDTEKKTKKGWGDDNQELEEEVAGEEIAQAELEADAAEVAEPVEKAKSLEEYLAELSVKREGLSTGPTRQANDGDEDWANKAEVVKKVQGEYFAGNKHEKVSHKKTKKEKVYLDFDARFAHESSRGGRGDRGGFRGGRGGRRGDRQSRPSQATPSNDDANFPSLGK